MRVIEFGLVGFKSLDDELELVGELGVGRAEAEFDKLLLGEEVAKVVDAEFVEKGHGGEEVVLFEEEFEFEEEGFLEGEEVDEGVKFEV